MWRIGELLVQKKLISWQQLGEALQEQEESHQPIGEILVRKGYVPRSLLFKALGEQHEMRFVELKRIRINPKAAELIPEDLARKLRVFPVDFQDDTVILAVDNPLTVIPEDEMKKIAAFREIHTVLCLPEDLEEAIQEFYKSANPSEKN